MFSDKDFESMTPVTGGSEESRITTYWPGKAADRKEGMFAAGTYVGSVTFGEGTDDESTRYKLRSQDGKEIYGVQDSAVIVRAFADIPVGSFVAIRFNGKKAGKNGRQYNDFEVRVTDKPPTQSVEVAPGVSGEPITLAGDEFDDLPLK